MRLLKILLLLPIAALILVACQTNAPDERVGEEPAKPSRQYYQLKVYSFVDADQQVLTDEYLAETWLPAMERFEVGPVGVFKNRPGDDDTVRRTYVLIPYGSLAEWEQSEAMLHVDSVHNETGKSFLQASHEVPPYQRVESILLKAFEEMPTIKPTAVSGPRSERVYELRSYESPTEDLFHRKVDMFNAGGEVALFEKLGFNAVFYSEVISGAHMPNLMYMTTFPNMESREEHWEAFVDAPEWKEMSSLDKYQHTVSHADVMLLYPTEYSDY